MTNPGVLLTPGLQARELAWNEVAKRSDLAAGVFASKSSGMRNLVICFCVVAPPAWAWEFTPDPICTLSEEVDGSSVVVTYDPRRPEYAIVLRRADPWPEEPVFAIQFKGPRGLTISTSRHQLSEGGTALRVADRGFGNVLDGLQFNETAVAVSGAAMLSMPLEGAAPAVEQFRACTAAPSV